MKTLIRDLDTGLLYCSSGEWVDSWLEATDYGDAEAAEKHAVNLAKGNLEIFVVDDKGRPTWGRRLE